MMKVGSEIFDETKGKYRKVSYSEVHYDIDGWVDAKKFLPVDQDLVYLKSPDHTKTIKGWSNGTTWDGLNVRSTDRIEYWKRHE